MRRPALLAGMILLATACTQKMGTEGHVRPYEDSRQFPQGTVARGQLKSTLDNPTLKKNPLPVNLALLTRGRERFNIYCAPCHGPSGQGDGMIVQRGFVTPPSYTSPQVKMLADGDIYRVISQGFGRMYSYADRVSIPDRWAIVAYIRALQLSQEAKVSDLPEADQRALREEGH